MISQQEDRQLTRCRRLIEEKVGWGSGEGWSTQDFDRLSERIAEQTGVSLSVTTLKRVWGRVKYDSAPTTTTLNALVQFVGYDSWQQFKNAPHPQHVPLGISSETATSPTPEPGRRQSLRRWWLGATLIIGLVGLSLFFLNYVNHRPLSPEMFSFSSQHVTKGIPNSVVFHYDATASPTDSVFIQQSWDPRRRQLVPKDGHEHTSIYYYPGYFRAKLVIGRQIVQEQDLLIPSEGWTVSVGEKAVPVYFKPNEVIRNGSLGVPVPLIQQQNIPMQPQPPAVRYRYVREFNGLRDDNFTLETRVKNDFKQGASVCQRATVTILCKNEFFAIPLSAKGCVGDLTLYMAGYSAEAKTKDLSGFGADLSQWVDVRCEVRNKKAQLFIGGKKAYEALIPTEAKDIVGISYDFEGTGSIDFVRFTQPDGKVVFEDDFDTPIEAQNR